MIWDQRRKNEKEAEMEKDPKFHAPKLPFYLVLVIGGPDRSWSQDRDWKFDLDFWRTETDLGQKSSTDTIFLDSGGFGPGLNLSKKNTHHRSSANPNNRIVAKEWMWLLAMQIRFFGFQHVQSGEHMGVFFLFLVHFILIFSPSLVCTLYWNLWSWKIICLLGNYESSWIVWFV